MVQEKKILIIHHWDTDGICSAAILSKIQGHLFDTFVPSIGNFFLKDDEIYEISKKGYDKVYILDMALPKDNIIKLKDISGADIEIFDHHKQEIISHKGISHNNPIAGGMDPSGYPSNTWHMTRHFGMDHGLLSILGALGDNEQKITSNDEVYSIINRYMDDNGLVFEDMMKIVYLIDSSYKTGHRSGMRHSYELLCSSQDPIDDIFGDRQLNASLEHLENEMRKQIDKKPSRKDGILIKDIDTSYNIISPVTRDLAWNNRCDLAIVRNTGFSDDVDQIYIRTPKDDMDLLGLIEYARSKGYSAGGKMVVAGIVLPKKDSDDFIDYVRSIKKNFS